MNPRYLAYCAAHGNMPDQQMKADIAAYPGGKMCGFLLWMSEQWTYWRKANGYNANDYVTEGGQRSFDRFIRAVRMCGYCGKKAATCYGAYEDPKNLAYACDDCCGHGCEDGKCVQLDPEKYDPNKA